MDIDLQWISRPDRLPDAMADDILGEVGGFAAPMWVRSPPQFDQMKAAVFAPDNRLIVGRRADRVVAFAVRRIFQIDGDRVMYNMASLVSPSAQGAGLYRRILEVGVSREQSNSPLKYLTWRTRNPFVWSAAAKVCSVVVPDFSGGDWNDDLRRIAIATAKRFYPDKTIEPSTLTMYDSYKADSELVDLPIHHDVEFNTLFYNHPAMSRLQDGMFCAGLLKP